MHDSDLNPIFFLCDTERGVVFSPGAQSDTLFVRTICHSETCSGKIHALKNCEMAYKIQKLKKKKKVQRHEKNVNAVNIKFYMNIDMTYALWIQLIRFCIQINTFFVICDRRKSGPDIQCLSKTSTSLLFRVTKKNRTKLPSTGTYRRARPYVVQILSERKIYGQRDKMCPNSEKEVG